MAPLAITGVLAPGTPGGGWKATLLLTDSYVAAWSITGPSIPSPVSPGMLLVAQTSLKTIGIGG